MRTPVLVLVLALLGACNPLQGTQGMSVSRSEFTDGTLRRPPAYDAALAQLEACAQGYVDKLPNPADSLGGSPLMPERIDAPLDSLVSAIYVRDKLQGDTAARVSATQPADGIFQRDTRRLFLSAHAYRLRDEVQHELGHALSRHYPALRNPPGIAESHAGDDHAGAFFKACVPYCPMCSY